jgi:hypothetical protein
MPMSNDAEQLAHAIAAQFRRRLADEYVPRIARCVSLLTVKQVWSRPNPHCNAVANLLLHLEGNVRQWILCGLGGQEDQRNRTAEFAANAHSITASPSELVEQLRATVAEAVALVEALDPRALLATYRFQGRYDESGVAAVLHVLEHFSGHAGQIYYLTKEIADIDLRHYDL